MATIPFIEYEERVQRLRNTMAADNIDILLVYGDEYRREHLRYVSNYWPIFERGMLAIGQTGHPVLLVAPECLQYAKEMSPWTDVRIIHEMEMAYVSDQITYSSDETFTTLEAVFFDILKGRNPRKIMVCGIDAMSSITLDAIKIAGCGSAVINGDPVIYGLRLIKSPAEIAVLAKAWEICDIGYKAILDCDLVGLTERQAAAIGEAEARRVGAEGIVFTIMASGDRTNTVIGRATERVIQRGDMVMCAMAIQYEGYIASDEWPFVAGGKPTPAQNELIRYLIEAEDIGIQMARDGVIAGHVVGAIRDYFSKNGLSKYDLYPPIHGNGLAEAKSPYPDEHAQYVFREGMGINFDVSLFGLPVIGSNRVEEGFIITKDGLLTLSHLISRLRKEFMRQ